MTRRHGGVGPAVISVIGPDRGRVREVVSGLRTRLPGHRLLVGAGPDVADGVIAVASTTEQDAGILRAVRDAIGGCVLYTRVSSGTTSAPDADPALVHEPGVTVVQWRSAAAASTDLDRLAQMVESLWVDIPRWVSDARRVDADRIDRVRVVVRLAAETCAAELLSPEVGAGGAGQPGESSGRGPAELHGSGRDGWRGGRAGRGTVDRDGGRFTGGTGVVGSPWVPGASRADAATPWGRARLSALFRARLRCMVLEQGVEWPHLAERGETGVGSSVSGVSVSGVGPRTGVAERAWETRMPAVLVLMMALGAGLAVAATVSRLMGPGVGMVAGVVVGGVLAMVRWRMLSRSRRAQDVARGVAILRRQWSAEATEVVARLRIPPVAEAISWEVGA